MRKFLFNIFWFIFPIVIIAYPLDLIISDNLKQSNDDYGNLEVWKDIYEGKANCEIAVYGSSRASIQINSEMLENSLHRSVYNFGHPAQNFRMLYFGHTEFIKHNTRPKIIIVSLDTFSLNEQKSLFDDNQFLPYLLFNNNLRKYVSIYDNFRNLDFYMPLLRYAGKREAVYKSVSNIFQDKRNFYRIRKKGFAAMSGGWNEKWDAKRNRKKYIETLELPDVELFEQFIKECHDLGIKVILIYSPEYIEHRQVILNRDEVMDFFRQFAEKNNLPFWDYSNDEICSSKEFFYDSLHLNAKGADFFSAKLALDVRKLLSENTGE